MAINMEAAMNAVTSHVGNSTYSMEGSRCYADGTCDCSGAVYYGLRHGDGFAYGYIPSTETLHDYLTKLGFRLIAENTDFPMQRGDVIIWGQKGYSAGEGGHTGIALDNQNWVECTAWYGGGNGPDGGTIISNHDARWAMAGCPYFYAYRQEGNPTPPTPPVPPKPADPTRSGQHYSIMNGKNGSKAHLDRFGPEGSKLVVEGWHTFICNHEYIFILDRVTGKELARKEVKPLHRPDVKKAFNLSYDEVGFKTDFDLKQFKGHSVIAMIRGTDNREGNPSANWDDLTETRWWHDL